MHAGSGVIIIKMVSKHENLCTCSERDCVIAYWPENDFYFGTAAETEGQWRGIIASVREFAMDCEGLNERNAE